MEEKETITPQRELQLTIYEASCQIYAFWDRVDRIRDKLRGLGLQVEELPMTLRLCHAIMELQWKVYNYCVGLDVLDSDIRLTEQELAAVRSLMARRLEEDVLLMSKLDDELRPLDKLRDDKNVAGAIDELSEVCDKLRKIIEKLRNNDEKGTNERNRRIQA